MAKTKSDIARLALGRIGLRTEEQEPSAYQQQRAEDGVDLAFAELGHHGIAYFDVESVPDGVVGALSLYVAGEIAEEFLSEERASYFRSQQGNAFRRIAAAQGQDNSGWPVDAMDY